MGGPFTGRGRKITGAAQNPGRDKYQPGEYYARIVRGVYKDSAKGHGLYVGFESIVVKVARAYNAEENKPFGPSNKPGMNASWTFKMQGGELAGLSDGNLENIATAVGDTEGFEGALTAAEQAELEALLDIPDDDSADPSGWILDKLVADGGLKFAGLPVRIVARPYTSKGGNHMTICTVYPVTADELAEHFPAAA